MRIPVGKSTFARNIPTRIFHSLFKHNIKLQVFDPVTMFIGFHQNDLISVDALGNPTRGFKVTGPMTLPMDFLAFSGEIWVTCNQDSEIEECDWPIAGL